ncbi:hypothetical protein QQF64_026652 [Cirrhinus molitorella]|uniref:Uncharacterized protein n=1 Tax=Cirrhinus molitorella TaxID=172907 RepID=A0ABR3NA59_9TELE
MSVHVTHLARLAVFFSSDCISSGSSTPPLYPCSPLQRSAVLIPLHLFALNEKQRMEKVDECENECWMTDRVSPALYSAKQFALLSNDGI